MRVIRRAAYQAHAVPSTAGYPRGPFNPEILAKPEIVHEDPVDDMPYGATAQNDYRGVPLYECRSCGDIVTEDDLNGHICG